MKTAGNLQSNIYFLKKVERAFEQFHVLSPRVEAEHLIERLGGVDRLDFFTGQRSLGSQKRRLIEKAVRNRLQGTPLAYLLGEAFFYGRKFKVTKDVLIPRPETEFLLETAAQLVDEMGSDACPEVLDLGTGSGCLAVSLTLAHPHCRMTALDLSPKALKIASRNAKLHGLHPKIKFVQSDLFCGIKPGLKSRWDLIVTNPPYVPSEDIADLSQEVLSEPRMALEGGVEGLEIIRAILRDAPRFLKDGGWLAMEIGAGQSKILLNELNRNKDFKSLRFVKDFSGIDRVLVAQKANHG